MLKKSEASRVADTFSCSNEQYYINLHPTQDSILVGGYRDCWFSAVRKRCDAEVKRTLIELVQKKKLPSFCHCEYYSSWHFHITGQQIFLFPRIGCPYLLHRLWWKPWLDLLSATAKIARLHTEGLLFVWRGGTRMRGSSGRSERGNCGTKRWLNCCKPAISCGFIVH